MKLFLIEGHCLKDCLGKHEKNNYPCEGKMTIGIDCFKCPHFFYAPSPHAIACSDENGMIENEDDWIGFGGDMFPANCKSEKHCREVWQDICRKKIAEAFDEYMKLMDKKNNKSVIK